MMVCHKRQDIGENIMKYESNMSRYNGISFYYMYQDIENNFNQLNK